MITRCWEITEAFVPHEASSTEEGSTEEPRSRITHTFHAFKHHNHAINHGSGLRSQAPVTHSVGAMWGGSFRARITVSRDTCGLAVACVVVPHDVALQLLGQIPVAPVVCSQP